MSGPPDERDAVVLVVDDIPMFRELEVLFLARFGRVVPVSSGEEALDFLARETPDIVVLDFGLPDVPAPEVMRALREAPATRDTPIVVVTTGRAEDHERAIRLGAADVVPKPLSRTVLVESVRRFLRYPDVRGLPRIEVQTPVRLWNGQRETWGVARNLSRGGMFIESDWLPPADTELHLDFHLGPEGAAFRPTAQLIWRRLRPVEGAAGIGVRFLALDGSASRRLHTFVHEHLDVPEGTAGGEYRRRPRVGDAAGGS
jgi:CheY-like chemotaxis protein